MEQKNNSGAIFRNEKKDKPTAPDYTGSAWIDSKKFQLSGWVNKSKSGQSYLRLIFTEVNLLGNDVLTKEKFEQQDDIPF